MQFKSTLGAMTLAASIASGAVLAQTTSPVPHSNAPATTDMVTPSSSAVDGMSGATTKQAPGEWRAFKLKGLDVYNDSEKVGDIEELLLDGSGKVSAVVIGVGGFLGMGEHQVAVPFGQLKFVERDRRAAATAGVPATTSTRDVTGTVPPTVASAPTGVTDKAMTAAEHMPDRAILNMTKEQLKAAPQFHYVR